MEPEEWEEFKKLIEEIENSPGQKIIEELDSKVSWIYYWWKGDEGQDASLRIEMGNTG